MRLVEIKLQHHKSELHKSEKQLMGPEDNRVPWREREREAVMFTGYSYAELISLLLKTMFAQLLAA